MPKHYSEMVISRLQDAGAQLDGLALEHPEHLHVSDLIPRALTVASAACVGLMFSQSPVVEATLALASSAG